MDVLEVLAGLWLVCGVALAICWAAVKLGEFCARPRQRPCREEKKAPPPPQPTHEERLRKIRLEFEQNLGVLQGAPMDEVEKKVGRERIVQKFIRDLDGLI
jgi:hypothetical protein